MSHAAPASLAHDRVKLGGAGMIRLGVIGAGAVVQRVHWPVLKEIGKQIRVVAVASRRPQNARAFARQTGSARVYNDYREMLQDPSIDAVLTAVPIELNAAVLIDAVRAAKHVMAE